MLWSEINFQIPRLFTILRVHERALAGKIEILEPKGVVDWQEAFGISAGRSRPHENEA